MVEFNLGKVAVMLCMPTHRDIPFQTVGSLMATQRMMSAKDLPFNVHLRDGNTSAGSARNQAANSFLESDCTHLFWVDSDMVWLPEDFIRLLCLGTVHDVIGATYPYRLPGPTKFFCSFLDGKAVANEYGCLPVKHLGLGFTCVQRHVMEELAAGSGEMRNYADFDKPVVKIFRADDEAGNHRTEDAAFFSDIQALGYTAWLDPAIDLGHIGVMIYRGSVRDHLAVVESAADSNGSAA